MLIVGYFSYHWGEGGPLVVPEIVRNLHCLLFVQDGSEPVCSGRRPGTPFQCWEGQQSSLHSPYLTLQVDVYSSALPCWAPPGCPASVAPVLTAKPPGLSPRVTQHPKWRSARFSWCDPGSDNDAYIFNLLALRTTHI